MKPYTEQGWDGVKRLLKAGVNVNLSEILVSLKERLKGKKRVMEHHQTVARPHNGTPGCWATVWSVSTNFLISNSNFKTTTNLQNFLFPSILLIL